MQELINKLIKERNELDTKITNLKSFIDSLDYPMQKTVAEEMQYIGAMIEQLAAMKRYSTFLNERIKLLKHNEMAYFKECENLE
ncbi:hypothetical protein QUW37_01195 [Ligilactobacillus aviarius]|uniref:crAss001_48 related protein n=1 Tax=Ligilactobacillus aviarius TaxID=1606 RepID=UPI0025A47ECE|nr:hypothetical protein [Ligilactobacillus aviarius]MDM8277832.1 hypothetical protein [Ligilactobacillus aviarius]